MGGLPRAPGQPRGRPWAVRPWGGPWAAHGRPKDNGTPREKLAPVARHNWVAMQRAAQDGWQLHPRSLGLRGCLLRSLPGPKGRVYWRPWHATRGGHATGGPGRRGNASVKQWTSWMFVLQLSWAQGSHFPDKAGLAACLVELSRGFPWTGIGYGFQVFPKGFPKFPRCFSNRSKTLILYNVFTLLGKPNGGVGQVSGDSNSLDALPNPVGVSAPTGVSHCWHPRHRHSGGDRAPGPLPTRKRQPRQRRVGACRSQVSAPPPPPMNDLPHESPESRPNLPLGFSERVKTL